MKRLVTCLAAIAAAAPGVAMAQFGGGGGGGFGGGGFGGGPPGGGPGGRGPGMVEGVEVRGQQGFRSSIDRRSYNVVDDLQTSTGSIGDALRNVPSVDVDVQGNVTMRGDNVTILVDGRPSALFRGDQAAAIQSFPADQIERVEVITNPSAQMSPEGSGGVINLVTRRTFRAGYSGSVRANAGTQGQMNGGVNAAYQSANTTASISGAVRETVSKSETLDERTRIDPVTGARADTTQKSVSRADQDNAFVRAGVDHDLSNRLRVGVEGSWRKTTSDTVSFDHQENENASGVLTRMIDRASVGEQSSENVEVEASFRQRFTGDEHELTGEVSREWSDSSSLRTVTQANRLPASGELFESYDNTGDTTQTQVRLDYNRPLGDSRLKAGYLLDVDDSTTDNLGRRGASPATLATDPTLTYDFLFKQTVHAVYATYQQPFGYLTVMPGLRLEQTETDVAVPIQAVTGENSYFKAYPSLHLAYDLSETQRLSASYSMRIQRPRAADLNPFRVFVDPFNFRQGNPDLKPQQTRSFEIGWQKRSGATYYLATAYYRQSTGGISDVVRDLGNGVFLTTRENLDKSRSGGLELVANGRLARGLTYNVSGNMFWNEIDASTVGLAGSRSAYAVGGRANLNWQATPNDFIQINGFASGKRLTAQGYQAGFGMLNLGYRRKLSDRLSFIAFASDVLGTVRQRTVIDTPTLAGSTLREPVQRAAFIGLTWTFGAVQRQQRDPGFEFGGGEGGAPE